jgi:hypothetical protein
VPDLNRDTESRPAPGASPSSEPTRAPRAAASQERAQPRWPALRRAGLVAALLAAACLSVWPGASNASSGAANGSYRGTTSLSPINGYPDPVSFTVAATGSEIESFSFGSFGCVAGVGGFILGQDPWRGAALKQIASITIGADDSFSGAGETVRAIPAPRFNDTLRYLVTGHFLPGGRAVAGTIAVSERVVEPVAHRDERCGPVTMSFTASR